MANVVKTWLRDEDDNLVSPNTLSSQVYNSDGSRYEDIFIYSAIEAYIGKWVDGKNIYRKVITVTDGLAKDNLIKVCDKPEGMLELIRGYGIVRTTEGAYSNNDILVYSGNASANYAIYAKQNFTSYPEKLYIIIEYTKDE